MEHTTTINSSNSVVAEQLPAMPVTVANDASTDRVFIQANTIASSLEEIRDRHIIPVFIKDNEPVISHVEFIETMQQVTEEVFPKEVILMPTVRLSHPIMGRIPEAKYKPAKELLEHEKTIYYERMAFVIEIPSVFDEIGGNLISLTVGGVKAYNLDNLYNRKGVDEHFKVFIGFRNAVCTNLCIWSDGYAGDLKVRTIGQLKAAIRELVESFQSAKQLTLMQELHQHYLSEQQFATLVGKCRMYQYLPKPLRENIYPLALTDNHIGMITKGFYTDSNFSCNRDNQISLWRLYNLFTGANKSSYIDNFLDRSINAYNFVERVKWALQENTHNWYLS